MSLLGDFVARMVDGGMASDEAMQIAGELFAAGVASAASQPSPGALRTRKWRHKTSHGDGSVTVVESVTKRHITSQSVTSDNVPLSNTDSKKRERQDKGSRIAADWSPSEADRAFAKQEGFSDFEIQREVNKFRDYWTACAGGKGIKRDWAATWRQWIRRGADSAGKTPHRPTNGVAGCDYYAKSDSEQLHAWDEWRLKTEGKRWPRDKNQGWRVKSEWPPGYVPIRKAIDPPNVPLLRSMQ